MARRRRRRSLPLHVIRTYPWPVAALILGIGTGIGADRWLDITDRAQLIVSGVVTVLLLIGKLILGIRYGAIYMFKVYHPHTGRVVCGYVGKTRQRPEERYRQHMGMSTRYATSGQPWSDTVVDWRVIHQSRYMTNIGLHLRERVNILFRRPLYNYTMNLHNPRRIPKYTAIEQREERDYMRSIA